MIWDDDNDAYERLSKDLSGPREEVALVVRDADGKTTKTVAVFHNASVALESAAQHYDSHTTLGASIQGHSIHQLRVTTDDTLSVYTQEYFSQKGEKG